MVKVENWFLGRKSLLSKILRLPPLAQNLLMLHRKTKMTSKKEKTGTMQRARVLGGFTLDGVLFESDNIIEADPNVIRNLGSSVDESQSAVDYCLSLKNPVIKKHLKK